MRMHVRILGVAVLLAAGVWFWTGLGSAAGNNNNLVWKPIIDEASALKLIKQQVQLMEDVIKKAKPGARETRKLNKRLQVSAVEIATFVQSAKPEADKDLLASYHEAALKLAKAASGGAKPAQIKKLVADLASLKANAGAKWTVIPLKEYLDDQADAMHAFKLKSKGGDGIPKALQTTQKLRGIGGDGIEEKVRALARRKLTDVQMKKEAEELALLADKMAALAQTNYEWAPEKDEGKKKIKDWKEWSLNMREIALDLAKAARKGDADEVYKVSQKLNSNCNQCHGIFKPE